MAAADGPGDPCVVVAPAGPVKDTVEIAISGTVDVLHAPEPRSPAERWVFAQLYETPLRVTCDGRLAPGLVDGWTVDAAAREVTLMLREGERFTDHTPVTADIMAAAWIRRLADGRLTSAGLAPWLESYQALTPRELRIGVYDPQLDGPRLFAHPALAVERPGDATDFPRGTGDYSPDPAHGSAGVFVLRPNGTEQRPVLLIHAAVSMDARDLLDRGADIVETDDPAVLDYASRQRDLTAIALPWDRVYTLIVPSVRRDAGRAASPGAVGRAATFRSELARDAVRVSARGAESPYWWTAIAGCQTPTRPDRARVAGASADPTRRRIVYSRDDRVAARLAERLVALASFGARDAPPGFALGELAPDLVRRAGGGITAAGLAPGELDSALSSAEDAAYVVALPARTVAPCMARRAIETRAPWLLVEEIIPLVETRLHIIARAGTPPMVIDWVGAPRVLPQSRNPGDTSR